MLPDWPTQRWRRVHGGQQDEALPFALTEHAASALRISALNPAARAAGLRPGLPLADARALAPELCVAERPFVEERADLERLARSCVRFSPFVAPVHQAFGAHGLAFDVTGAAHLFGGETAWLEAVLAALNKLSFTANAAIADTVGLAAALAGCDRRARAGVAAPVGAGLAAIGHLPVRALRLNDEVEAGLRAVGLKTVADLARIARASLARRFGVELITRLDQAAGLIGEPIDPIAPASPIFALRKLLEPITAIEALNQMAGDLAAALAQSLDAAANGVRQARLDLFCVDGAVASVAVGFARAEADPRRIGRILKERMERALEGVDLGFGVEAGLLIACALERREAVAVDLDPEAARRAQAEAAQAALRDALCARLGDGAVMIAAGRDSHIPERAQTAKPGPPVVARADRPLFLLARPEPIEALAETPDGPPRSFRWRRMSFRVARAQGPERIGAEWWRASAPTRDYFRIETAEGRRLWLFREGLYGRETDRPRWFVHGSFA